MRARALPCRSGCSSFTLVVDRNNKRVLGLTPGSTMQTVLPVSGTSLVGVAVGKDGTVYVSDQDTVQVTQLSVS